MVAYVPRGPPPAGVRPLYTFFPIAPNPFVVIAACSSWPVAGGTTLVGVITVVVGIVVVVVLVGVVVVAVVTLVVLLLSWVLLL